MDLDGLPPPNLRELRILVLYNLDFQTETTGEEGAVDLERSARADVVTVAQEITRTLAARGHFVEVQGIDVQDIGDLLNRLRQDRPDLVFNLCESLGGDDRNIVVIPTLLEMLNIPCTGSGSLTLGLCLHKDQTKQILRAASLPTPPAVVLPEHARTPVEDLADVKELGYPLFLKLVHEEGSLGISNESVVRSDEELLRQLEHLRRRYREPVLVERYIEGREIYVPMLGNGPQPLLPMQELDFSQLPAGLPHIVSERSKWDPSSPEYQTTNSMRAAPMSATVRARIEEVATKAFAALNVRDFARCDIRLASNGTPYIIDVNPNCDLSSTAGFSRAGALAGMSYDQLIEQIALAALKRYSHANGQRASDRHSQRTTERSETAV